MVNNYRPVKLLSVIDKLFERVICDRLQPYLENNFLCKSQAGFHKKCSMFGQLVYCTEKLYTESGNNKCATGVFLDISKAFGRIWVKGLIFKLINQVGLIGKILTLLSDFLQHMKM